MTIVEITGCSGLSGRGLLEPSPPSSKKPKPSPYFQVEGLYCAEKIVCLPSQFVLQVINTALVICVQFSFNKDRDCMDEQDCYLDRKSYQCPLNRPVQKMISCKTGSYEFKRKKRPVQDSQPAKKVGSVCNLRTARASSSFKNRARQLSSSPQDCLNCKVRAIRPATTLAYCRAGQLA